MPEYTYDIALDTAAGRLAAGVLDAQILAVPALAGSYTGLSAAGGVIGGDGAMVGGTLECQFSGGITVATLDAIVAAHAGVPFAPQPGVTMQGAITREIDALSPTGTVDDTVLLFDGGAMTQIGSVALADWITRTDSGTLGTTFEITQAGVYACLLYVPLASGHSTQVGVTYNAPVAIRQGNFEPFDPSVFSSNFKDSSTDQGAFPPLAVIPVSQDDVDAGTAVIRAQMSNVSGGPPAALAFGAPLDVALRICRTGVVD